MSKSYVQQKTLDALKATQGDAVRAQRLLTGWAMSDMELLAGLTQPFLKGIVGHAVARAEREMAAAPAPTPKPLESRALDGVLRQFGRNFEAAADRSPESAGRASARHAETIRSLAVAQARFRLRQS